MGEYSPKRRTTSTISLFDPDYAILLELVSTLEGLAADMPAKVLDFGAGNVPYRSLFEGARYIAADVEQNYAGDIDLIIGELPLALDDDSIDLILCIYVLEHIKDYAKILTEFRRILRPGGRLFVATPFIHREHEAPNDFHRPTSFSLAQDLEHIGPTVVRKVGSGWFTLYSLANEMHIKEGERFSQSNISRWIRGSFNHLLLPLCNRFVFSKQAQNQDSIYHTVFASSKKET